MKKQTHHIRVLINIPFPCYTLKSEASHVSVNQAALKSNNKQKLAISHRLHSIFDVTEIYNLPLYKQQRAVTALQFLHSFLTHSTAYSLKHHASVILLPDESGKLYSQKAFVLFFIQISCPVLLYVLFQFHVLADVQSTLQMYITKTFFHPCCGHLCQNHSGSLTGFPITRWSSVYTAVLRIQIWATQSQLLASPEKRIMTLWRST